jgi:hypothetical protein
MESVTASELNGQTAEVLERVKAGVSAWLARSGSDLEVLPGRLDCKHFTDLCGGIAGTGILRWRRKAEPLRRLGRTMRCRMLTQR